MELVMQSEKCGFKIDPTLGLQGLKFESYNGNKKFKKFLPIF